MKNVYTLEKWVHHNCKEKLTFTNKKEAQKWLKNSGWWTAWEYGFCSITILKNGSEIDFFKEKGWYAEDYVESKPIYTKKIDDRLMPNGTDVMCLNAKVYETYLKEHRTLEIIKKYIRVDKPFGTACYIYLNDESEMITQEEFDLLKEVLKNEQKNKEN